MVAAGLTILKKIINFYDQGAEHIYIFIVNGGRAVQGNWATPTRQKKWTKSIPKKKETRE
jgi:hypothetical protein